MKKADFYGKFILRYGDLLPEEIDEWLWKDAKLSIKFCMYLKEKGLLFDGREDAMAHYKCIMGSMKLPAERTPKTEMSPQQDKGKRIYLSGPVSYHDKEEVIERFKKYANYFTEKGYRVFNPLENGLPYESDSHLHMRRDLNILTNETDPFDYIFMMKKWTHSAGCWKEFENAVSSGNRIIFEEMDIKDGIEILCNYAAVKFE